MNFRIVLGFFCATIAANSASAKFGFEKVASMRAGDEKNLGFTDLRGMPSVNQQGDVAFWANTSGGERLYISDLNPETVQYDTPRVVSTRSGHNAGLLGVNRPVVVINNLKEVAFTAGSTDSIQMNISGCGLPLPSQVNTKKTKVIIDTNIPIPLGVEKNLAKIKNFEPKISMALNTVSSLDNIRHYKVDSQGVEETVGQPGRVFCGQTKTGPGKIYRSRYTAAGAYYPDISLNNRGDVVYFNYLYQELFVFDAETNEMEFYSGRYSYGIIRKVKGKTPNLMIKFLHDPVIEKTFIDEEGKIVNNVGLSPMINDLRDVVVLGSSGTIANPGENENIYVISDAAQFKPVIQRKYDTNLVSPFNYLNFTYSISNTGLIFFSGTKNNEISGYFAGRYSPDSAVNDYVPLALFKPEGDISAIGSQYPVVASQINLAAESLTDKIVFGYGRDDFGFSYFAGPGANAEHIFGITKSLDGFPTVRVFAGRHALNNFGRFVFSVTSIGARSGKSGLDIDEGGIYVARVGEYSGVPNCGEDGLACLDLPPFSDRGTPANSCFYACAAEGQPVNVATGAMWHPEVDFSLPGRTGDLQFVRTYLNQPGSGAGDFGPNWHHNYETKLIAPHFKPAAMRKLNLPPIDSSDLMWIDENGGAWLFRFNPAANSYTVPTELRGTFQIYPEYFEIVKRDKTIYRFHRPRDNKFGKILAKIDRYGVATEFTYDNFGRLSAITMPMAGGIYFGRDGAGRVIQIYRDRDGLTHHYEYDSNGRLSKVTHFDGAVHEYGYNTGQVGTRAHGMLRTIKDPLGRVLTFYYYNNGKAQKQVEPGGGVFNFSYNGNVSKVRRPDGGVYTYYNDSSYRTVKKILPDGTVEYTGWSADGFKASEGKEMGGITRYGYDANGNLTSVQLPGNNAPTRFTYDVIFNQLTSIEPLVGAPTTFGLDSKGDYIFTQRGSLFKSVTRDDFGNILSSTNNFGTYADQRNENGQITYKFDAHNPETRTYDTRSRLKTRSFASGQVLTYSYDDRDRVTNIQDSHGPDKSFVYDIVGKVLESRVGDGANKQVTTFTYDSRDRIRQIKNALNEITTYNYDPVRVMDKPSSITDAAGRTTYFTYDKLVRLVRKQEPNGAVTKYTYDVNDRLTSVEDANGQITRYSYDLNGNKIKEVRPSVAGNTAANYEIEFYYDLDNRLVKKRHVSKRGYNHREEEFIYDPLDRLVRKILKVEKSSGFEVQDDATYSYLDLLEANVLTRADNSVAKLSFSNIGAPPFSISSYEVEATQSGNPLGLIEGEFAITRDVTGEISSVSHNGSNVFTKQYDPAGRLSQVQSGNLTINLGYDAFGRKASQASSDGANGSWAYDMLNRITNIAWTGPTPITQQLTYDLAGNITNMARENGSYTLGYDANDQLISSTGLENRSYVYDALGNRLQDSINGPGEFVNNFLKQNSVSSFLADQEGFGEVVRETTSTQEKNYTYRADGKISGYQSGNLTVQYFYDGLDRLVAKAINDGNQYTQSFTHLEDENRVLLGKAGDNSVTTYIDGQGMAERLAEVKGGIGKAYVTDHLGSVLNSSVAGVAKSFGLWGEIAQVPSLSPASAPVNYGFTGHMVDTESGLNRTKYRQYESRFGRWLAQDPLGNESGDLNYFRYVGNSPSRFKDLSGLSWLSDACEWAWRQLIKPPKKNYPNTECGRATKHADEECELWGEDDATGHCEGARNAQRAACPSNPSKK